MLKSSGINRGAFSILADAIERDPNYDWGNICRCGLGKARELWGQPELQEGTFADPTNGEPALVALGINETEANALFFDLAFSDKWWMVTNLRRIAAGGAPCLITRTELEVIIAMDVPNRRSRGLRRNLTLPQNYEHQNYNTFIWENVYATM